MMLVIMTPSDDVSLFASLLFFFDNKAREIIIKLPLITQLPNPEKRVHVFKYIHNLCRL